MAEWTVVKKKKHSKSSNRSKNIKNNISNTSLIVDEVEEEVNVSEVIKQIDSIIISIKKLSFVKALLDNILKKTSYKEIVAYGIGSLSKSSKAKVQFALAEIIRRHLLKHEIDAW